METVPGRDSCQTSEAQPLAHEYNRLCFINALDQYRFRPESPASCFIENRQLAIMLDGVFPGFRDIIHERIATAPQVVEAMIAYRDQPNDETRQGLYRHYHHAMEQLSRTQDDSDISPIFNSDLYDQRVVHAETADTYTVIDVLQQIQKNTAAAPEAPAYIQDMDEYQKIVTRDRYQYADTLRRMTEHTNEAIRQSMQSGDYDESLLQAVEWLEYQHMAYLQQMDFDTQVDFYKTELFKQLLTMHSMTHGVRFCEDEFVEVCEVIAKREPCVAARMAAKMVTALSGEDAQRYRVVGREDWVGALWSGSVTGQLQQLVDPRPVTYEANRQRYNQWVWRTRYPIE
ncbi:MAG: hypothetical protein Q4A37_02260 [Candidatus Saccharibacteria bacterium]|nr:hypothetical protein [Candidatus Saccharibacteria bacterium]